MVGVVLILFIRAHKYLHTLAEPMDPRAAFYGGRTNAVKLYHKIDEAKGEKILYKDVCSLYPWVCKYGSFPVGHPEVITENFKPMGRKPYRGLKQPFLLNYKKRGVNITVSQV